MKSLCSFAILLGRFGEDSADKMVNWLVDHVADKACKVIDLGCGNGHLLFELASLSPLFIYCRLLLFLTLCALQAGSGFTNMLGIDYSQAAIDLAKEVAVEKELETIEFSTADLIDQTFANEHRCVMLQRFFFSLVERCGG